MPIESRLPPLGAGVGGTAALSTTAPSHFAITSAGVFAGTIGRDAISRRKTARSLVCTRGAIPARIETVLRRRRDDQHLSIPSFTHRSVFRPPRLGSEPRRGALSLLRQPEEIARFARRKGLLIVGWCQGIAAHGVRCKHMLLQNVYSTPTKRRRWCLVRSPGGGVLPGFGGVK